MGKETKRTSSVESSAEGGGDASADSGLRWNVQQRLSFIEERLFWLGTVNRADIIARFGVSMSQASGDIARYLELEPEGLAYDKSAKCYVAGDDFRPVLRLPDARQLLGELRLFDLGIVDSERLTLGEPPPLATTPLPERPVDPFVLRVVLRAIRESRAMSVGYQSMSRPEPLRRIVEPHALAHDGYRWHARAFDRENGAFRDFVIGRMSEPRLVEFAGADPADDSDWHSTVTLEIAPHPALGPAQSAAIARDYGISGTSVSITVRRSLLYYALKRLGFDVAPDARPPHEQQIVLVNRDEVDAMTTRRRNREPD